MDSLTYTQIADPGSEQLTAITNGLNTFGLEQLGGEAPNRLALTCNHPIDGMIAGAIGHSLRHRFYLTQLWVAEAYRSKGIGKELLSRIECIASQDGCHDIAVDTLNMDAVTFYEHFGFQVYLKNKNYIQGFDWHFLSKVISDNNLSNQSKEKRRSRTSDEKVYGVIPRA